MRMPLFFSFRINSLFSPIVILGEKSFLTFSLKSGQDGDIWGILGRIFNKILLSTLTRKIFGAIMGLKITPIITIGAFFIAFFRGGSSSRVYAA